MKWRSKKTMIGGGLVVVLIVMVAISMSGSDNGGTTVQVNLAYVDEISEIVTASGRVQPQTKVDITAEVSAQIIEIYVRDGDRVAKGTPLLLLDTIQLKSDVAQAGYSLEELTARGEAAKSTYERDRLELERQSQLHEQNLTSETEFTNARFALESARANWDAVRAQMNTARSRLEKALDNLRKTSIVAPMSGFVTYLGAEVGEIAQAQTSFTQGKTLLTVSDLSVFEVDVDVDETEISKVGLGQSANIRVDAFADTVFKGSVVDIGNSALIEGQGTENYTTSFRAKVRFAETDAAIRPGMSATVDITTAQVEDALLIPYAAVVTRQIDPDAKEKKKEEPDTGGVLAAERDGADSSGTDVDGAEADTSGSDGQNTTASGNKKSKKIKKTGVFVCKNGEAQFVEITTGIADDRNIVALTGLAPGDTVISGSFQTLRKLSEGDQVHIEESSLKEMEDEG